MIRQLLRRSLLLVLAMSLAAGATAAAAADEEPSIVFFGGGYGHGIGLSQYGTYGRAQAGQPYDEILAHYYAGTTLQSVDSFGFGADDVDVLITIRGGAAIAPPAGAGGWAVSLSANGVPFATSDTAVMATYVDGRWSALAGETELCTDLCVGAELSFTLTAGSHVVLKDAVGGANLGNASGGAKGAYAGGRIVLHPAALGGGCGGGAEFCVIHADLDLQTYLKGIAEIPTSWPAAAQQAQVVAARSYAASAILRRAGNGNVWDLDDSVQDQYYVGYAKTLNCGNWCAAVDATDNEVIVHEGVIAEAFYSASNGGHSAEPPDVWANGSTRPYLQAVPDKFDGNEANPYAAKEYVYPLAAVSRWLNNHPDERLHVGTIRGIEIDGPASGRVNFASVTIHGTEKTETVEGSLFFAVLRGGCESDNAAGTECEALRSTNFTIRRLVSFADVEYDDYFFLPVQWMTVEGLTKGVSPELFGAEESNTRAQLATFLWRFAGQPAPTAPSGFDDVPDDTYFTDAVEWLKEAGVTTGVSATEFAPEGTVTRAQAAAFLWRFAGEPTSTADVAFTDVPDGRFFTEAIRWMVEWDITTGTSATTYSPDALLTRAQIATFLWRLAGTPEAFAESVALPPSMRAE